MKKVHKERACPFPVPDGAEHISGGNMMKKHGTGGALKLASAAAAIMIALIGFSGCEQPTSETPAAANPGPNNPGPTDPGAGVGSKGLQLAIKDNLESIKSGDSVQLTVTFDGAEVAASDILWKIDDVANKVGVASYVDAHNVFHAGKNETRDTLTVKAIHKSKNLSETRTLTHIKYRDFFGDVFTLTNKCVFPDFTIEDDDRLKWNFSFNGNTIDARDNVSKEYTVQNLRIGDINDYFIETIGKQSEGSWAFLYQGETVIGIVQYSYESSGYTGFTDKPCYWSTVYLGKTEMSDPLIAYAKYTTSEAEAAIAHASTEFKAVLHGEKKIY